MAKNLASIYPLDSSGGSMVCHYTALLAVLYHFTRWKTHHSRYVIFEWLSKMEHRFKLLVFTNHDLKTPSNRQWPEELHKISLFQGTLQTYNLSKRYPYPPVIGVCFKYLIYMSSITSSDINIDTITFHHSTILA